MNVVIIEDEIQTARDLQNSIAALRPDIIIKTVIDSVESGVEWFSENEPPDLIFSDIQLGDGLAFDILRKVDLHCPVVFCTAYDEYGLLAFQNNGIDYLLKPINEQLLEKCLTKIDLLKKSFEGKHYATLLRQMMQEIESQTRHYKSSFLVAYRDKLIPIRIEDIAFFGLLHETTKLFTYDNKEYQVQFALDHLETLVDPRLFYRANRQNLVAYTAIKEVEHFFDRKLLVKLSLPDTEPVMVSKAKATDFLNWMENR